MKYELETVRNHFWNPMREFNALQRGINRLFDDLNWVAPTKKGTTEVALTPSCDIEETEGQYLLSLDLPGVKKEDIKVDLIEHDLVISGERKDEKKEEKKSRHVVERYYGSFQRVITLPATTNTDQIQASFENGVLKVTVPKAEAAKTKQIHITDGKAATSSPSTTATTAAKTNDSKTSSTSGVKENGGTVRIA